MSMVLTRSPLQTIGMNGAGTQKRRSARLSQESVEENEPPAKKSKVNSSTTTTTLSTKEHDGDVNAVSKKKSKKSYDTEIDGFSFTKGKGKKARETKQSAARTSAAPQDASAGAADVAKAPEDVEPKTQSRPTARTEMPPPPLPAPIETPLPKTARKNVRRLPASPDGKETQKTTRRSKRVSSEDVPEVPPPAQQHTPQVSPHRAAHAKSHANNVRSPSPDDFRPVTIEKKRKRGADGREEERKTMRINLPSWDTPMMKKNKNMRKTSGEGSRRSSTGMRGRRVSGLVDEGRGNGKQNQPALEKLDVPDSEQDMDGLVLEYTGGFRSTTDDRGYNTLTPFLTPYSEVRMKPRFSLALPFRFKTAADNSDHDLALPHAEVLADEFFKHIPADIPEPRRMKILLGWCGERALPPKPEPPKENTPAATLELQALQAARIIQEELSKDLFTNGTLSDWFSRDESIPAVPLKKKPNPRNITNAAKAEELEKELERLENERAEWEQLSRTIASPVRSQEKEGKLSPLHPDLLDSPQRSILEQLESSKSDGSTDPEVIQQKLSGIADNLEFTVDQFTHGVHTLATTKQTADRLADKTLSDAATVMEERDKSRPKTVDGMNSLKALGKLLNSRMR